jgi:hypothetical protein
MSNELNRDVWLFVYSIQVLPRHYGKQRGRNRIDDINHGLRGCSSSGKPWNGKLRTMFTLKTSGALGQEAFIAGSTTGIFNDNTNTYNAATTDVLN